MRNVNFQLPVALVLLCLVAVVLADQDKPIGPKGQFLPAPQVISRSLLSKFVGGQTSTVFEEDFETGGSSWSTSGIWEIGAPTSGPSSGHGSTNCAATNLNGQYTDHADDWLISSSILLPILAHPSSGLKLAFWEWLEIESGCDYARLKVSTDEGVSWTEIGIHSGTSDWRQTFMDLSSFAGETVKLGFHFTSDGSVTRSGWYIDDICITLEEPEPLSVTLVSLSHQNFPFIYLNVAVDTFGVGFPDLTQSDFQVYENSALQTDYFDVTPPDIGGGVRLADIVFLMDNSGSMEGEQAAVRDNVIDFVDNLVASGVDFALGLCRFGALENYGYPISEDNGILTSDPEYFKNTVWGRNVVDGGFEPGWDAIYVSASSFSFRPGSQKVFILITDECVTHPGDTNYGDYTYSDALSILQSSSTTLFSLIDLYYTNSIDDYGTLSEDTNGAYFHIYSAFDEILDYISSQVANTYLIRYYSSDPVENGIERLVQVVVSHDSNSATTTGSYIPGSAPHIVRTQATIDLHDRAWAEGTEFTIEVEIEDNVAPYVLSATVYYKSTQTPSYQSTSMTNTGGNTWEGTIDGSYVQTPGIDYYVSAFDGENTASDPSVDPINNPYQLAILPNVAPQITHTPISILIEGVPITVTAEITDNTNSLAAARLYYRKTGQLIYQEAEMIQSYGNYYEGDIHTAYVTSDGVDYYIKAWDDFGVGSSNATFDEPHQIQVAQDISLYLDEKIDIIDEMMDIERPIKETDDPFFETIEEDALEFATRVRDEWQTGTSDEGEVEAVARLAISERTTLKAIEDVIPISSYGAQGLRSVGTSLLLNGIFKGLAKTCQHIPIIGNSIHKALLKVAEKFERGAQRLFHLYVTGDIPVPGIPYQTTIAEYVAAQQAANSAFGEVSKKIAETGIEAVSENEVGSSLFDTVDGYMLDYLFLDAFELVAEGKQREAVRRAQDGDYEQEFEVCLQDVTQIYDDMVSWNSFVNDAAHFVNTLREIVGWVTFAAAIVVLIICIIAAIPTGGLSLLGAIGAIAASVVTYSTLISSTLAITEASTVGVYVDMIVPNVFLDETVDDAFGVSDSRALGKASNSISTGDAQWRMNDGEDGLAIEYCYVESIDSLIAADDYSFLKEIDHFNSIVEQTTRYENQILALSTAVFDTALSLDDTYYEKLSELSTSMASRVICSAAMDIYALVWNNGLQTSETKAAIQQFITTYKGHLSDEMALCESMQEFITENELPVPPIVGIDHVQCYKDDDTDMITIEADVANYSSAGPLTGVDVVMTVGTEVVGDSIETIVLAGRETKKVRFEISSDGNGLISGVLYTTDHATSERYRHMGGYPFSYDVETIPPSTGGKLGSENIYFFPNPFDPEVEAGTIRYSLSNPGRVTISVYDATNMLVRTILEDANREAECELSEQWDGKNESGERVDNGVYFYVIESSAGERAIGKVAVLR